LILIFIFLKINQLEIGAISFPDTGKFLLTLKYGGSMNFGHLDFLYNDARQK